MKTNKQTNKQTDRQTDTQTDKQTNKHMNKWTTNQPNKQTNKRIQEQTQEPWSWLLGSCWASRCVILKVLVPPWDPRCHPALRRDKSTTERVSNDTNPLGKDCDIDILLPYAKWTCTNKSRWTIKMNAKSTGNPLLGGLWFQRTYGWCRPLTAVENCFCDKRVLVGWETTTNFRGNRSDWARGVKLLWKPMLAWDFNQKTSLKPHQ